MKKKWNEYHELTTLMASIIVAFKLKGFNVEVSSTEDGGTLLWDILPIPKKALGGKGG